MHVPSRRLAALALLVAGFAVSTAGALAAPHVSLAATAGLSHVSRPGRWTAVRVDVENTGDAVEGELIVDTGEARVHRAVALPSPSRKRIEIYVRAPGPEVTILRVWLAAAGTTIASADVPLRPADADLTLCAEGNADPRCTLSIASGEAPGNWRGLDAADALIVPPSDGVSRWNAVRSLRQWIAPAVAMPAPSRSGLDGRTILATYLLVLLATAAASRRLARSPARIYAVVAIVSLSGVAAVVAQGRVGPGSSIVVTQTVILRADQSNTFVDARGTLQVPSHDRAEIRPLFGDLALVRRGKDEQNIDEDGLWRIPIDAAKGQRVDFEADGFAELPTLKVSGAGTSWRLTNAAPFDLVDCDLPSSFTPGHIGSIARGASVDITGSIVAGDSALACSIRGEIPLLASDGWSVETHSSGALVFDLAGGSLK